MIKFKYEGPVTTGFASIGRELDPDEEFDVPEDLALSFDGHGHCTCLEPEKLAPLRAAAEAAQAEQDALRASSGLANAHPLAPQPDPAGPAAASEPAPPAPAPAVDQPGTPAPDPSPATAAVSKRAAKTDPSAK